MKVSELMLGDWVNYRPGWINEESGKVEYESGQGFPVKIEMMYESRGEGLVQYNDGENDGIEAAEYELFPLPLTAEILEKNGFEHMSNSNYDYDDGYGCLIRYNTWNGQLKILRNLDVVYNSGEYPYMAVHILQHALRLCGIDQKIKI